MQQATSDKLMQTQPIMYAVGLAETILAALVKKSKKAQPG
jgi:hypothetical protein